MGNQTFTSSGSWVCPSGVTSVTVECWAGGGAGGVASGTASGAGGGAGGQYAIKEVAVSPGTSYTVTVATAAVAVITGGVVTNGSDSWFNTTGTVIAKGGAGGADATGATGAGGTGSTTGGIGDTVFAGGSGASGVSSTQSGGGGGGAGSTGTGNSGSGATAGAAKTLNGGAGGNGVSTANTQNNGQNYGGGGSGGLSSSATNRKGGDGAPGLVVLTWDIDPSIFNFPYTNQGTQEFSSKKRSVAGMSQSPFVPQVSEANAVFVHGQSVDPGLLMSFQYQSHERPFLSSTPPPLTYIPNAPVDLFNRPARRIVQAQAGPVQVSTTTVQQTYIHGQSVDPASVTTFQYPSLSQPIMIAGGAPAETLTLDKWNPQSREPVRRARRLVIYGVNCAIAKEVVPTMEWSIQQPLPGRPRQGLKDYSFRVFTTGAGPEVSIPAVFIQGQSVDPQVMINFQYDSQGRPLPQVAQEVLTLDRWASQFPARLGRHRNRQEYGVEARAIQITETLTLDKWISRITDNRSARRVSEGLYATNVSPTVVGGTITLDKWYRPETVIRRATRRIQGEPSRTFVAPLLPPMTWYQPAVTPRRVLRTLQYLYPNFSFVRIIVPPVITGDPAVWQNLGTVSLKAVDLATVTLLLENLTDPMIILFENTDVAVLVTENTGEGDVMHDDDDIAAINYEDTDIA